MRDICITAIDKKVISDLKYTHFVYEVELKKLKQPFFHTMYFLYLVARGEGEFVCDGKSYPIKAGTLVLVHPWTMHEIIEKEGVAYLYISFYGDRVSSLLDTVGASEPISVYNDMAHLLEYWMQSIRRVRKENAFFITDSVFMHTISYLICNGDNRGDQSCSLIEEYIRENLSNPGLSLGMVASVFFYSEKYFSHYFKEKFGVRFTEYVHEMRVDMALRLISEGERSVLRISEACGYENTYYFSKIFKKTVGKSPTACIREHRENS
ncbi:MAG: AraC family transcriptional regulator [Ruminococcaceae bacterium]|nr:AraC family transcriptional regulator [Oscillospiraceae bacterium]